MNIKIPHRWLLDYIKTDATPEQIAQALSLRAFSVEKLIAEEDGDTTYEIEVTPNRGDALSVQGIAREVYACLSQEGIHISLVEKDVSAQQKRLEQRAEQLDDPLPLTVEITQPDLVPQFSAVILDQVAISQSPEKIRQRLKKVGIRALDNVVDVTNYFMVDKGQPMHSFDYDKIKGARMIVRESRAGEVITTLDGVKRKLPAGVIVIEDGDRRLIDLCGIMGAENSAIDAHTKRVLLFVQIYDPRRIRRASMALGHRTDAAVRFEKGIDPQGVIPSLWEATAMLQENAQARVASRLINTVNHPYRERSVPLHRDRIREIAGVAISDQEIEDNLRKLGFGVAKDTVKVPSWRADDIAGDEDLAEEVIRLYGYHNLPDAPLTGAIPPRRGSLLVEWEQKARLYLKHQGFCETYHPSATTAELAGEGALALANPLSQEMTRLRTTLFPLLATTARKNANQRERGRLFELASVYLPQGKGELPRQPVRLALAVWGVDYRQFKGVIEGLYQELELPIPWEIQIIEESGLLMFETDFGEMAKAPHRKRGYLPPAKFAPVKQDLALIIPQGVSYFQVERVIREADKRVRRVAFLGSYRNTITVRVEMLDRKRQLNDEGANQIRERVLEKLGEELAVRIKSK